MNIIDVIDELIKYMETRDDSVLLSDVQLSTPELSVVVIEILSWLQLEHKRSIWISQGRKNCLKPLKVDKPYPWCADLYKLVEKEALFRDYFSIKDGKFDFSDTVSEEDKIIAREKVYQDYKPSVHILIRS